MSIFNHITAGTNDLDASQRFYDLTLETIGIRNLGVVPDTMLLYGAESSEFMVTKPVDGNAATLGNGVTIGFKAGTRTAVHAFHAIACANGGSCEGAPGPRESGPPGNYVAYVRDPVGNKLVVVTYSPE